MLIEMNSMVQDHIEEEDEGQEFYRLRWLPTRDAYYCLKEDDDISLMKQGGELYEAPKIDESESARLSANLVLGWEKDVWKLHN